MDYPNRPLKTGMAEIAKIHTGDFRLTANQNLIVAGVAEEDKARIERIAREHGLMDDSVSEQRKTRWPVFRIPRARWQWRKPSAFTSVCYAG